MFFFLVIYGKYCAKNKTTTLFGVVVLIAIAFAQSICMILIPTLSAERIRIKVSF